MLMDSSLVPLGDPMWCTHPCCDWGCDHRCVCAMSCTHPCYLWGCNVDVLIPGAIGGSHVVCSSLLPLGV